MIQSESPAHHPTFTALAVALVGLGLAACVDEPAVDSTSSELAADTIATAREQALAVAAAHPNERFLAIAANFDGVILFDPSFTEIAFIGGFLDRNDWLRLNHDGTGTIHVNDHDAFAFYGNFDTFQFYSGTGGNLQMDFTGPLTEVYDGHYYAFFAPTFNFHGTAKVQPDGGGPTSTLVLHSSMLNGRLNEFIRLN